MQLQSRQGFANIFYKHIHIFLCVCMRAHVCLYSQNPILFCSSGIKTSASCILDNLLTSRIVGLIKNK